MTEPGMLQQLLDASEAIARRRLLIDRYNELTPFYHLVGPEGGKDAIIPALWGNLSEKLTIIRMVKRKSRELGSIACLYAGEAWMIVRPPNTDESKIDPPSESPDRIEAVLLIATDGVRTVQRALEMIRDRPGGTIIDLRRSDPFGEGEETEGAGGRIIDGIVVPHLNTQARQ